jgi:hypothetical protein
MPIDIDDASAITALYKQLLDAYNELGLEGFSEVEFNDLKASNVQLPCPPTKVGSGINVTRELFTKFDDVIAPLTGAHFTSRLLWGY